MQSYYSPFAIKVNECHIKWMSVEAAALVVVEESGGEEELKENVEFFPYRNFSHANLDVQDGLNIRAMLFFPVFISFALAIPKKKS